MMKTLFHYFLFVMLLCAGVSGALGQQVLDVPVHSAAMNRDIDNVVILPKSYDGHKRYPVLFLLHGYNMKPADWLAVRDDLPQLAEHYGMLLVCPNGANSWYIDSAEAPESMYETYVVSELVPYVDAHYATLPDREHRAVAGLSMGGHGALWLAIRHQSVFSACGSMSGAVDLLPFPNRWGADKVLGDFHEHRARWSEFSVCHLVPLIRSGLSIILDCGTADFFHETNEQLHHALLKQNVPHVYISAPGSHNRAYWNQSLLFQLLFFAEHFRRQNAPASAK